MAESSGPRDASSNFIWPPVIYATATLAALALCWWTKAPVLPAAAHTAARITGVALALAGIGVAAVAELQFLFARTATLPIRPTSSIVTTGIYAWSRNPMYLGMSLFLAGLFFWTGSVWFLLALPVAMFAVTKLAIEREERYLTDKFGTEYTAYASRVRRWL